MVNEEYVLTGYDNLNFESFYKAPKSNSCISTIWH